MSKIVGKFKYDIQLFALNLLVLVAFWGPMLRKSFNSDTVIHAISGYEDVYSRALEGRFVLFFIDYVLYRFGVSTTTNTTITSALAFILFALIMLLIHRIFRKWEPQNLGGKLLFWMATIFLCGNVLFAELLMFTEFSAYFGLAYFLGGLGVYFYTKKKYLPMVCSFLIAVNSYQYSMIFAAIILVFFILMDEGYLLKKRLIIREILAILLCLFMGLSNILLSKLLVKLKIIDEFRKISGVGDLFDKIGHAIKDISLILKNSVGIFPDLWIPLIFELFILGLIIWRLVKKKSLNQIWGIIIAIMVSLCLMVSLAILDAGYSLPNRMSVMFFLIQGLQVIIVIDIWKDDLIKIQEVFICGCIGYLAIHCLFAGFITGTRFISNTLDKNYAEAVIREIEKYEKETGNCIEKICIVNDIDAPPRYDAVKYQSHQINERTLSICNYSMIDYVSQRSFIPVEMDPDVYASAFEGKNWDYFDPREQMVFDEDTVYWCVF